jgi:outer membrane protein
MMRMILILSLIISAIFMMGVENSLGQPFTLNHVYELALQENEEIRIARQDIVHAQQEKRRAVSTVIPKLTLNGTYTRFPEETISLGDSTVLLQPEESYGMDVTLEQPLFAGGKNWAGIRMAKQEIRVARKNLNLSTETLLLHVAEVFYGVLKSQKDREAHQRNVERLLEHRRLSELRYQVGEVTETVLLRAEAELADAHVELVVSENELAIKKQELRILTGIPEGFEIEEPPLPRIPENTGAELLDVAYQHRDDVLRSQLRERISKEAIVISRADFFPTITLEGTYFNRDQEPRSTFFIDESWFVGGRIEFPIFEGGLRIAEMAQARSRLKKDALETARLKKQIHLDVTRSQLTLKAVTRALQSRQKQLSFAMKNFEMVSKQFTFGLVTNIDLLDANQVLIEAERDVIAMTYDQHLAILDLQRSAGVYLSSALDQAGVSL